MLTQLIAALLLSSLLVMPVWAGSLSGTIVSVYDGDTATLLVHRTQHKIRLAHIDCPERTQAYGTVARQALADLIFQKDVMVETLEKDRYGRWVGEIYLSDRRYVNAELIYMGACWWYQAYSKDTFMGLLQDNARDAHRGLWQSDFPIEPWVWRKMPKAERKGR